MAVSSPLATEFMWSPNHYNGREFPITRITIHHMASVMTARACGVGFATKSRRASSTYGIGYDGSIAQYVDEADAPWTSSSYDNDNRAITIEVSNSERGGDWPISEEAMDSLINLCADICKRNPGIGELKYTGDLTGNLTMHKWFAGTQCPGPYLSERFGYVAQEVNKRLGIQAKPAESTESTELTDTTDTTTYTIHVEKLPKEYAESLAKKLETDGYKPITTPIVMKSDKTDDTSKPSETPEVDTTFNLLDKVRMTGGAPIFGLGHEFQSWVYNSDLYVRGINGDRITVSICKTGAVTGDVHKKYLTKI